MIESITINDGARVVRGTNTVQIVSPGEPGEPEQRVILAKTDPMFNLLCTALLAISDSEPASRG